MKQYSLSWLKSHNCVPQVKENLGLVRQVGDGEARLLTLDVTIDCTLAEHRSVIPGDDIHIWNIRNLAGCSHSSMSGGGRMSTRNWSQENNG